MKIGLYCFSVLMILASCHSSRKEKTILNYEKNDLETALIYGKVKQVHLKVYVVEDSLSEAHPTKLLSQLIQNYTPDGYLKTVYQLNNKLDTVLKENYHYQNGKLAEIVKVLEDSITIREEITYSAAGFKEFQHIYRDSLLLEKSVYKTNDYGFIAQKQVDNRRYVINYQYQYDNKGLLICEKETDLHGIVYKQTVIEYDESGLETNKKIQNAAGKLLYYYFTTYDKDNLMVSKLFEDALTGSKDHYYYFKPDKKGNWRELIHRKNQQHYLKTIRKITYY